MDILTGGYMDSEMLKSCVDRWTSKGQIIVAFGGNIDR
jgi:hypothetical protein